jgi:CBS domain-containing protein
MTRADIPIADYMSRPALSVPAATPLEVADRTMREANVSALAVTGAAGDITGVVTRTDLLRAGAYEHGETLRLPEGPVEAWMSRPVRTIEASASVADAARQLAKHRIHRLFVVEDEALVGVISTRDLMSAVCTMGIRTPIGEIATRSVVKVKTDDPLVLAVDRLDLSNKHGLVVVHDHWPVGVFAQADALLARARDPQTRVDEVMDLRIIALAPEIPLHRAAAQALALGVRRIFVVGQGVEGIVSGLDFARVLQSQAFLALGRASA